MIVYIKMVIEHEKPSNRNTAIGRLSNARYSITYQLSIRQMAVLNYKGGRPLVTIVKTDFFNARCF